MDSETDTKNLEKRLKKAALAWACTLTPPTAFVTPEPGGSFSLLSTRYMFGWFLTFSPILSGETEEILEEKLRRGRREGTFYKWSDDEETSGNEHYNNRILFALFVVFNYELLSRNSAVINIGISLAVLIMSSLCSF